VDLPAGMIKVIGAENVTVLKLGFRLGIVE